STSAFANMRRSTARPSGPFILSPVVLSNGGKYVYSGGTNKKSAWQSRSGLTCRMVSYAVAGRKGDVCLSIMNTPPWTDQAKSGSAGSRLPGVASIKLC
ncbi:MAG TPA: hypothetical protein PL001_12435, partial [Candidatus Kryptobacter bacterium]|nr:hypothetical protein [Candidatus Kryptobacter bacterium]